MEWRGFLADLLRMAHVSEIVKDAIERFDLSDDVFSDIQLPATVSISSHLPDWHQIVSVRMREVLPGAFWKDLPFANPLARPTGALLYVQVGSAESIHIVPDRISLGAGMFWIVEVALPYGFTPVLALCEFDGPFIEVWG